jgi:hypothetical protein
MTETNNAKRFAAKLLPTELALVFLNPFLDHGRV